MKNIHWHNEEYSHLTVTFALLNVAGDRFSNLYGGLNVFVPNFAVLRLGVGRNVCREILQKPVSVTR
jgi:hypothetical protein